MKKVIQKVAEEIRQDKNGRNYKYTTFKGLDKEYMDIPGVGKTVVAMKTRTSVVNLYEKSYLNDQEQFAYSVPVNGFVFGAIETRFVQPYELPDNSKDAPEGAMKTINTYSCVVFGDSTSPIWDNTVAQEMKSKGHIVVTSSPEVEELQLSGTDSTKGKF